MKKSFYLLLMLLATLPVSCTSDSSAEQFITDMFNNALYQDYDFLREHCSERMLAKLASDYDYDTDGEAYAVWDFRTSAQDSKVGDETSDVLTVSYLGEGWYEYEFIDMGWRGKNKIKLIRNGDDFIIDDVVRIYDELTDLPSSRQDIE